MKQREDFDIDSDVYPRPVCFGISNLKPLEVCRDRFPEDYEKYEFLAMVALDAYDWNYYDQEIEFEVVEVKKVNYMEYFGNDYCITFTARDVDAPENVVTFQARVMVEDESGPYPAIHVRFLHQSQE